MRVLLPAITVYYFNHLVLVRDGRKGYKMGREMFFDILIFENNLTFPSVINIVFLLSELTIQIILVCMCSKTVF